MFITCGSLSLLLPLYFQSKRIFSTRLDFSIAILVPRCAFSVLARLDAERAQEAQMEFAVSYVSDVRFKIDALRTIQDFDYMPFSRLERRDDHLLPRRNHFTAGVRYNSTMLPLALFTHSSGSCQKLHIVITKFHFTMQK